MSRNSETIPTTEKPRTRTSSRVNTSPFRRSFSVMMLWAPPAFRLPTRRAGMRESGGGLTTPRMCHPCERVDSLKSTHADCTYVWHVTSLSIIAACRHVNQTPGPRLRFRGVDGARNVVAMRVRTQRQHAWRTRKTRFDTHSSPVSATFHVVVSVVGRRSGRTQAAWSAPARGREPIRAAENLGQPTSRSCQNVIRRPRSPWPRRWALIRSGDHPSSQPDSDPT